MKRYLVSLLVVPIIAGCGLLPERFARPDRASSAEASSQTRPAARPEALASAAARRPPEGARTAEALDTTTAEERQAAAAPAPQGARSLGSTVASLGDPARPGFWLETPLVSAAGTGRVDYQGQSAQVELIPIDGPASGGSRISLAAMRLIGAPLTGLPTVEVFTDG